MLLLEYGHQILSSLSDLYNLEKPRLRLLLPLIILNVDLAPDLYFPFDGIVNDNLLGDINATVFNAPSMISGY